MVDELAGPSVPAQKRIPAEKWGQLKYFFVAKLHFALLQHRMFQTDK